MPHKCATKSEFDAEVSSGLVVVDYYTDWCGPCKMAAPHYERFSEKFTSIKFLKVDGDALEDVLAERNVDCFPTFQFFKDGKKVDELQGASIDDLEAKLVKLSA